MPSNMCDEITYPLLNVNEWISNFISYIIMGVIIIHAGIKVKPW